MIRSRPLPDGPAADEFSNDAGTSRCLALWIVFHYGNRWVFPEQQYHAEEGSRSIKIAQPLFFALSIVKGFASAFDELGCCCTKPR